MQTSTALAIAASPNLELSNSLLGIEAQLQHAAHQNLDQVLAEDGGTYTDLEKHAMLVIDELKMINGMDLAAVLLRGKLLHQIEEEGLYSVHPNQYHDLNTMAKEQGISVSELSNVRTLYDVIFPYIQNTLHRDIAEVWEEIGKSNFRDLVGVMQGVITGHPAPNRQTQSSVRRILDDVEATARAAGQTLDEDSRRQVAVERLLEVGQLTNAEVRQNIRPERTPSIEANLIQLGGHTLLIADLDDDQVALVTRRLHGYMDPQRFALPPNPRQAQLEAARIPVLRTLVNLLEVS
ncbi:MAG: hypothetical protein M1281_14940 [Chloroflexi bacterium]|nr:hypothetical protein [Chloroflexota bacterium]